MNIDIETQKGWFADHVRRLVNAVMENHDGPDADGDYLFQGETCYGWIHPATQDPWAAQFFAVAALGVPDRVGVLRELNAINGTDPLLTLWRKPDGAIMISYRLAAEALTETNIRGTLLHVIAVADRIGPMLAAVHGGHTPKPTPRTAITEG